MVVDIRAHIVNHITRVGIGSSLRSLIRVVRRLVLRNARTVIVNSHQDRFPHPSLADFLGRGGVGAPGTKWSAGIEHILSVVKVHDWIAPCYILIVTARQ